MNQAVTIGGIAYNFIIIAICTIFIFMRRRKRKAQEDFMFGGRQMGWFAIAASIALTALGGGHINGMTGQNVHMNANGIPFVPFDGYISILHRGERVLPAQENRSYTANSNLYVQNMNMNNGMDAQALAAAMRAQQERTSKGFGS